MAIIFGQHIHKSVLDYEKSYLCQKQTRFMIGIGIEIHRTPGFEFLEIVYKDAFEYEFRRRNKLFEGDKMYDVLYKRIVLPHKFYIDFVLFDQGILKPKMI